MAADRVLRMTSTVTCPLCLRGDGLHESCRARLDVRLDRLPGLYVLLGAALEPGSAAGDRVSGSREAPIPVRLEPLNLRSRGGMASVLGSWERDWRETRGLSVPPSRTPDARSLAGIVMFLRVQLEWAIAEHPAVDEFAGEVHSITRSCYAALGLTSTAMRIGDCPAIYDDGGVCGKALYADPFAKTIRCARCRASWPDHAWLMLGKAMHGEEIEAA